MLRRDGGQAVVLVALSMTVMLLFVGLAVDAGRLFDTRRSAQAAADVAAMAGAATLYAGGTGASAVSAAIADAAANGFTGGGTTTVTAVSPPSSGAHAGDARYVEVVITRQVTAVIMPAPAANVRARAVGGIAPLDLGYAIVSLDEANTSGALSVSPQGSLALNGGGIMINSKSSSAGQNSGAVTISPSTYGTDVVGDATGTWPNERTGRPALPDPLANFPKPDTSGLLGRTPTCCALQPGIYTSSIGGNNNWTMATGTYVLKGAGIDLAGNSSLTGSEVFIFITTSNYPSTGGSCASPTVKLTGNNASSLTPPTSGTYQGMLIYQDPACAGAITVGGNGAITTSGTLYAPSATVSGNGNNASVAAGQIVAKRVDAQNADLTLTYSASSTAQPRIPALAE